MANGDSLTELFGEPISVYTRAQAISDGVLVDLGALAPEVCAQHYKHPVGCTAAVWAIIDAAASLQSSGHRSSSQNPPVTSGAR